MNIKEKIILICKQCGEEFKVIPCDRNKKFCSHEHYLLWMKENKLDNHKLNCQCCICKAKRHEKLPEDQKKNIGKGLKKAYKEKRKIVKIAGKTYEEVYGKEVADFIKAKQSKNGKKKHNMSVEGLESIRRNNRIMFTGKAPWNKDKVGIFSEETLEKMRVRTKGKTYEEMYGKERAKEIKKKIGITTSKLWEKDSYRQKVSVRRQMSKLEEKMLDVILRNNLPYRFVGNFKFSIGKKFPDFIRTDDEKIAIEVYGSFYKLKGFGTIKEYEKQRKKYFLKYGWETIFFHDFELSNEKYILEKLKI